MSAEPLIKKKRYTFEEYLKLEEQDQIRYEYYNGEVLAMAGGSMNHADIADNINTCIKAAFRKRGCRSFQESIKVALHDRSYVYPDVVLTCDAEDIEDGYLIKQPLLIVEVLSPSTESYDRGIKSIQYRRLSSLRYYLLVSQSEPQVQLYSRSQATELFLVQDFSDMEAVIEFPGLDFSLSLRQIYENIRFSEKPPAN